jgi:hypothetical protein
MRQFKIAILWQETEHIDVFIHTFHPSHTKSITADEFLSLMTPCVTKTISSCSLGARNYILDHFLGEDSDLSTVVVQLVEEVDA